jgi:hypothetical protein
MKQFKVGRTTIDVDDTECEYCNQEVELEGGLGFVLLSTRHRPFAEVVHFDCHELAMRALISAAGEAEAKVVIVRNFANSVGDFLSETEALRLIRSRLAE